MSTIKNITEKIKKALGRKKKVEPETVEEPVELEVGEPVAGTNATPTKEEPKTLGQELNAAGRCAKCRNFLGGGHLLKNGLLYCSPACTT